jgi:hypothetical protein
MPPAQTATPFDSLGGRYSFPAQFIKRILYNLRHEQTREKTAEGNHREGKPGKGQDT